MIKKQQIDKKTLIKYLEMSFIMLTFVLCLSDTKKVI